MRRGAALALAALAGCPQAAILAGCGGATDDGGAAGALDWVQQPRVISPDRDERVVSGEVRNDSLEPIEILADQVRIVDDAGSEVEGDAIFLTGFVHGLYPPTREPSRLPDSELARTGRLAQLAPGETTPLTAAWRLDERGGAQRIDYGAGSLPIP